MPSSSRIAAVFLAALLLLTALSPSPAHADYYEDYTFDFGTFGDIVVTGYRGDQSEINVKIDYKKQNFLLGDVLGRVTAIGPWAFAALTGLTAVTLPDSLKSIGSSAFSQCRNLSSIMLPAGLEHIGDWAFSSCDSLTGLLLPEGLRSIGKEAFSCAGSLGSLKLPDSLTSIGSNPFVRVPADLIVSPDHPLLEVREGVLFDRSNKQLITYPFDSSASAYTVPDGTNSIGEKAFFACDSLQTVILPASVTSIGRDAFAMCPDLILRVERDSYAAAWAGENAMPCEYSDMPGVPDMLRTPTPASSPDTQAEAQPETYIPEDFPNIFSRTTKSYLDEKIYYDFFQFALITFNGREIISPVKNINNEKVYAPYPPYELMATRKHDENNFWYEKNKDFFENKDEVIIINVFDTDTFLYFNNLDINDPKFSKLKESQNKQKNITIGEFIELFKQMVPREMLPIKLETPKVNINPTIPKFKEDFLNTPVDYKKLELEMIIDRKTKTPTFVDFNISKNGIIYNFFSFTYAYENMNSKEFEKYERSIGYNTKKNDSYFTINNRSELLEFIGKYYPSLCEPLADCKTNGDLLEVYQMLPLVVQRQYKESDFQDNPYVDPAWLASRPAPPPYAELRDGSSGQEVLDMKARFLELGYFRTDKYNDQYSRNTADTVKLFEKNNGLPVDGIADAVMLGVLFSDGAVGK